MPIYKLKLIERREISRGTFVFSFDKPEGFTFKPGQYGGFTLINPTEIDQGGITRRFSLLCAPHEPYLSFATRIQNSAYKRVLNALPIGSEIKFAGPTGTFTLHDDPTIPAVLIAGGIGISPFYSMIQHATEQHSPQIIYLFYGNQTPIDAALLNDLTQLQNINPNLKLILTMEKADDSWSGERGYITPIMIRKYLPDLNSPMYYICGSPTMVTVIQEMLAEMGINEDTIKVEDFPGY